MNWPGFPYMVDLPARILERSIKKEQDLDFFLHRLLRTIFYDHGDYLPSQHTQLMAGPFYTPAI
jgi:hypothetical protein